MIKNLFMVETSSGKVVSKLSLNFKQLNATELPGQTFTALSYSFVDLVPLFNFPPGIKYSKIDQYFFTSKNIKDFNFNDFNIKRYNKYFQQKQLERYLSKKIIMYDDTLQGSFTKEAKLFFGVCSLSTFFNFFYFNEVKITDLWYKKKITFKKNFPNFIISQINLNQTHKLILKSLTLTISMANYLCIKYKWCKIDLRR
jgi:hypothetical protein